MYKYKRGIGSIEQARKLEFCLSNNLNTYLSMSATLENKRPYHALYIKNNKVIVPNIFETIQLGNKEYKMMGMTTSTQAFSCDEYISGIDLDENTFEYDLEKLSYKKHISFIEKEDMLYVEYEITNKSSSKCKFYITPLLTYKDILSEKKANSLKFNQREVSQGQLINLSITDQENIVLKSDIAKYVPEQRYLKNVKYEYIDEDSKKEIYSDDLYIPGDFFVQIKPNETKKAVIYISDKDFSIAEYTDSDILKSMQDRKEKTQVNINEEYVELRDLAVAIDNFDMNEFLISSIPSVTNKEGYINSLLDIVKSIEGQYLVLGKIKEAKKILLIVDKKIEDLVDYEDKKQLVKLKLWYVESINRLLQKSVNDNDIDTFFEIVKKIIQDILDDIENNEHEYMKYIDIVCLWYNALKIFEYVLKEKGIDSEYIYMLAQKVQDNIMDKFWYEEKRIMKYYQDEEESIATVDMIYAISLSYQCVFDDIPIKLLDTIFKELYTPYGLRELSKNSSKNNGNIYPKYLAHFVKANLRQNGVTRASQKIAYNLVKELILDINKYVNGGVKKIYHEKGIEVGSNIYDLHTNAEVIRLYDMLT